MCRRHWNATLTGMLTSIVWASGTIAVRAQTASTTEAATPAVPGHSMQGEAFNDGPRRLPTAMAGTGKIYFPISSTHSDPAVQRFFEQGVGQLHGFWYFEAERSFRQAAKLDPQCPMAYWGLAMATREASERAAGFMRRAVELRERATERERLWIDALSRYFPEEKSDGQPRADDKQSEKDKKKDEKKPDQRRQRLIRDFESILEQYPDDVEAKAFLAWAIWDGETFGNLPISSHQAVDALLEQV